MEEQEESDSTRNSDFPSLETDVQYDGGGSEEEEAPEEAKNEGDLRSHEKDIAELGDDFVEKTDNET